MFRLFFITFTGSFRGTEKQASHVHESPAAMTIPLIILAILSIIGGFVGVPEIFKTGGDQISAFLAPVIRPGEAHHISHATEYMLMGISTGLALLMIVFAWLQYRNYQRKETGAFGKLLENKWYVDELYENIIVKPLHRAGQFFNNVLEKSVIDGLVNGVGRFVHYSGRQLRLLQSGQVGSYVLMMVLGMVLIFVLQFFLRK
jgi:NADH-quinone oxidoreductase subunit L